MAESKKVWKPLRRALKRTLLLKRLENKLGSGLPDVFYCSKGVSGFLELKHLKGWPVREETTTALGISAAQKLWLWELHDAGGKGFVFVRIGEEWLLIPVCAGLGEATRAEWMSRAILQCEGDMVWHKLLEILLH